jgi:predicted metal-binding protein
LLDKAEFDEFTSKLGIDTAVHFDAAMLAPEERIRKYCADNLCGCYGKNYMCPPQAGSIEETKARLGEYNRGILVECSTPLDVKRDIKGLNKTKLDFHRKILKTENYLKENGASRVLGLIGGNCSLCEPCYSQTGKPCAHPDRARSSLEAQGIDVMDLRRKLGLEAAFHADKITWTGCLLID